MHSNILENLLRPHSLHTFKNQFLFQKPYAAPSTAKSFYNFLSWDLLEEILSSGHDDCWLPKYGQMPDDARLRSGRLSISQAIEGYQNGRTLLIRHAEKAHPRLAAVAADFYRVFNKPIDIQIYCTPPNEEGFGWHYDLEEVFVIQSLGQKEFYLYQNREESPPKEIRKIVENDLNKYFLGPEIRCHLKAGDWLYIPSGYWHKAKALTASFHLSVGVIANEKFDSSC